MVRFVAYFHSSAWYYVAFSFHISSVWRIFVLLLFIIVASLYSLCLPISSSFSFLELCSEFRNSGSMLYVLCFFLILWYILLQNVEHLCGPSYPVSIFWNRFFSVPVLGNSFIFNPTRSAFSPVGILHLTEVKLVQRIKYLIQSYTGSE